MIDYIHGVDWSDPGSAAETVQDNWNEYWGSYREVPADSHLWTALPLGGRRLSMIDSVNLDTVIDALASLGGNGESWAYRAGYVMVKVVNTNDFTPHFLELCQLMASLAEYPCLDDTELSRREYESAIELIKAGAYGMTDDQAALIWRKLWAQNVPMSGDELPSDEQIKAAGIAAGVMATCPVCEDIELVDRPVNPYAAEYQIDCDPYPACDNGCYGALADELVEYLAELWASFTVPATCPIWVDFGQAYQPMLI